jgi:hypothetical protein
MCCEALANAGRGLQQTLPIGMARDGLESLETDSWLAGTASTRSAARVMAAIEREAAFAGTTTNSADDRAGLRATTGCSYAGATERCRLATGFN